MHELGITTDMLEAITEKMREYPGQKVSRIVLEIGKLSAVFPDAIRFSFDVCCAGTVAEGASLEIVELEGRELKIREMEIT